MLCAVVERGGAGGGEGRGGGGGTLLQHAVDVTPLLLPWRAH